MERREEREGDKMEQKEKMQRTEVSELKGSPYMMSTQKGEGGQEMQQICGQTVHILRTERGEGV